MLILNWRWLVAKTLGLQLVSSNRRQIRRGRSGNGKLSHSRAQVELLERRQLLSSATITITAVADTKVYDGTTASMAMPTVTGLQPEDSISNLMEDYQSKNVLGANQSVLFIDPSYSIHNVSGTTYTVVTINANGTINKAALAIIAVPDSKTYDATTTSTAVPNEIGLVGTDSVTATEAFKSKNALGTNGSVMQIVSYTVNDGNSGKNYAVGLATDKGTITPASLTISAVTNSKVYDGTTSAAALPSVTGLLGTDSVSSLTEAYTSKNVLGTDGSSLHISSYAINDGNGGNDYTLTTTTSTGTITPAALSITAAPNTKVYDGNTSAAATPTVSGLFLPDTITGLTETYASKDVKGTNASTLSVTGYALHDGNSGNNYTLTTVTGAGTINPAALTITAAANTKVYDSTTSAAATPTVTGLVLPDSITGLSESYDSRHVLGTNLSTLTVNAGYTVNDGNGGNDYTVTTVTQAGTITPAALSIAATTNSKAYDTTTSASAVPIVSGLLGTDTVDNPLEAYASKNVLGTNGSTLNVTTYTVVDGNGGNDYTVTTSTAAGSITPASLTIDAVDNTKVYDGTTTAAAAPTVTGLLGTDTATGVAETYTSKNVLGADASILNVTSYTINDGNGGGNYSISTSSHTGTITAAVLTITAATNTKVYDTTTSASAMPDVSGLQGTDSVSGLTESYTSKNVLGTNLSTLNVDAGYTVNDGNSGNNYTISTGTHSGTITPAALTVTATTYSRIYDATTSASAVPTVSGLLGGDMIVGTLSESYASKDVLGTLASTLNVNNTYTVSDGNGGNNYSVTNVTAKGTITAASLTIAAVTNSKRYDGTTSSTATPIVTGLLGTDSATGVAEAFASKNVLGASNSTLQISAYTINDGNGGNDYHVTTSTAAGTITKAALTITANPNTKVYDGTTSASTIPTPVGLKTGDSVSGMSEYYLSKDVLGTGNSVVTPSLGFTINDGNSGGNYVVGIATNTGTITPAALTITAAANTKVYDANTSASATPTVSGLFTPDSIGGTLTESYASKDVLGTNGSTLNVNSGYVISDGNGGNDYVVSTVTTSGTITPAALTITALTNTKVYDATTSATATPTASGLLGTDSVSGLTEAYASKDVKGPNGSTLNVSGYVVNDGNNGHDYTVTTVTVAGTITPAALTITAATNSKTYDATTSATATPTHSGLLGTDSVSGLTEAYVSKNVLGTNGSTLNVTGYTVNDGNAGNDYTVTTATAAGTITKAALTITAATNTKVYDATTAAGATPTVSGVFTPDTVTGLSEAYASKDVLGTNGSTLNVTGYTVNDGNSGGNYTVTTASTAGTINPAALTITAVTNNKVYDATTSATGTPTYSGTLGTDTVTGLTEAYASKDVLGANGSKLNVTGYAVNDGNSGHDYTVTTVTAAGTITPAALTITAATNSKTYDATTSATATPTHSGLLGTDSVSGLTEAYVSKNVLGTNGSTLNVTGYTVNDGNAGNDYTVTTATAAGTITKAALTITATANTKVYDGTTSASAVPTTTGLVGTDSVTGLVESYGSKDVLGANGSTLNVTGYTVSDGNGGGNYLVGTATAAGTITPAALTIIATTNTKVYDATTSASATPTVSGLFTPDTIGGTLTESYASKSVLGTNGSTLVVNSGYVINDGNGGNDYVVGTATAAGTITPAALTITAVTNTRVYDGTTSASGTPTASGLLGTDSVSGLTEAYASKDVKGANGSTLNVSGYVIHDGNSGSDYTVTTVSAAGTITPAALSITAVTNSKTYDGTTSATAAPTVSGLFTPDTVAGLTEAYVSKNVLGTNGSTLNVTGYVINDGNSGGDYTVTTASTTGTITKAALTITAAANTKVYDATTSATATPTVNGLFSPDTVTGLSEAYASKDVLGTGGSTLNVTGYSLIDGNSGGNYTVTTASRAGTITPAGLTISAVTNSKVYDATTSASGTPTYSGTLGTDTVTGLTEAYASKDVLGTNNSTLNVSGYTINDGNGGNDYSVTTVTAAGTITKAALTITAATNSKTYDATTSAAATPTSSGLLGTDSLTGLTESYASKNVLGTNGSTLNVTGYTVNDGNGGGDYTVTTASTTGTIIKAALTITAAANTKVYDGTTSASAIPTTTGLKGTDSVTGMTEAYASKDVLGANGSTLNVTGYTVNDSNGGGNYFVGTASAAGTITPAALTISAITNTKVYDATTSAAAVPTVSGLLGTDSVTGLVESYGSKDVLGTNGSALNVTGYTINDGNSGADYTVTTVSAAGTITPAALTITATTNSKVYDATTSASAAPTASGLLGTDSVTGLTEAYASKDVKGTGGSKLNVTGYVVNDGNSGHDYTVTTVSTAGTITPAALSITAVTNTKVYDATTSAAAAPTVSGLLGTDTATGVTEAYASKNVLGTNGSTLNVATYTINDGNGGADYSVTTVTAQGTITVAALTISATTNTKVYDATTSAAAIPTVSGLRGADTATGLTEAYAFKDVLGTNGSTLNVTGYTINDGNGGSNYAIGLATAKGTITPAALTITALTNSKVYDATTTAAAIPTVSGLLGTDTASGVKEAYASKDVLGTNGSTLNVSSYTINDGNGGADYTVTTVTAAGTITPAALTITAAPDTKIYDGTTSSSAFPTVSGLLGTDSVTGLSEAYASKDVLGTNGSKLNVTNYTVNDSNSGADYTVTTVSAAGTITPAALTISATTNTRVYDSTTSAAAVPTVSGLVGADTVTGLSEAYASKDVLGTNGSTLNVTGYTVNDGHSGNDYSVTTVSSAGTITPAALTITAASNTKVYDATTSASATPTYSGILGTDTVTGLTESYASKDVLGTSGSTLNVTGYSINDGNSGQDYTVTTFTAAGTITPAALTITAVTNSKTYDATTTAAGVPTVTGLLGTDTASGVKESYASKNVLGTNGSTLNVTSYTINDGNSGNDYAVTTVSAAGTITKAALTITAATKTNDYDGTTSASAIPSTTGLKGTDTVTGLTEAYASKDVLGTNNSTLNVTGYTVNDGNSGGNYFVGTASAAGTITPAALTITAAPDTKIYDATTTSLAVPTVSGLLGTDTVTGLTEAYASKDVLGANGSTLNVTGYTVNDGNGGADYAVTTASVAGTITPAALTITATTNSKVYDATTSAAAVPTVSGLLGTDTATGVKEAYASKDVLGTNGSTLNVTSYTINDGNGGADYTVTTVSTAGTITPAALTLSAVTNTKVYDGTTLAAAAPTVSGLLGTDSVTSLKESYASKDVLGTNGSTLNVTNYTVNDGNSGADYTVTTVSTAGTITPAALTISATTNTRVYDSTTSAAAVPTVSGLVGADTVTGLSEAYASKDVLGTNGSTLNVTSYTVNDGNSGHDYTVTTVTAAGTITPAALTITAASNTKVYDATTSALAIPTYSGILGTDTLTGLTEAYASKDVLGTNGSTLNVSGYTVNDGNSGNDYAVTTVTAKGTITPAALSISAVSNTKIYDATTSAAAAPTVSGLLGTDTATGVKETYSSKDVLGTNGSTLNVTSYTINDGNSGNDYVVTTSTAAGTITPAALTITAATNTKVYDATTSAAATPSVIGLAGTDTVTGLTEAYTSKDVLGTNGSTLVVTGYTVNDGNGGHDYTVGTSTAKGTITPAALTITATSNNKIYDATTSAAAIPTVSGLLGTDTATGVKESYASKDVLGTFGSTLNVTTYTVNDGNNGADYTVTTVTAKGTITPASLTIAAAANTKVYDATTSASAIPTVSGLLGTDTATGVTEAYASKDVLGTNGSTLNVTGYTVNDGNGGADYTVTTASVAGTITPAALTIAAATNTKAYDGTTSASATPTVSRALGTDTVTGLTEAYASKDVLGTNGSTLNVTGYTVNDGNSGHDYTVTTVTAAGTITPAALTITAATNTKVYDATTSASATPTVSGLVGTDTVTGLSEAYASKDVLGTNGSKLNVTGYTVNDGNSGHDYTVTTVSAAGTITPAALTITAVANSKVYDATTSAAATPTYSGLLGTDSLTGLTESYASKDVLGTNASTLNITGYAINDGNSGHDYTVTTVTATGTITPAALSISAVTNTKVYDATTSAAALPAVSGLLGTDTATGVKETYASKDVLGTNGSTLTVTSYTINDGNGGNDYTVTTSTAAGTITPAALTITATTNTKVYDATTSASAVPTVSGLLGTDSVSGLKEAYASKDVLGTNGSTLDVTGYTVSDGNGGNDYAVTTVTAKGTITPAALTITALTNTKVYDATNFASATPTVSGLLGTDTATNVKESYVSKDVLGTNGSTLTVTGYTINDGNSGNDYAVTTVTAKGTITPAALTITAVANTKVYDGTTAAAAKPTVSGLLGADTVTGQTEAYTSKDVKGTNGSTLLVSGYTVNDGNGGNDYTVTTASAAGTITPAALTISAVANTKVYDATTSAAATPTVTGLVGTDTATGLKEAYTSKDVKGTNGSTLQVIAYTINDGNNGNDYSVGTVTHTGTITPAALSISAVTNTKVYDATTTAAATPAVSGLLGTDTVNGLSEAYTSRNVLGTNGSTLVVSGYTVNDGNSGNDYVVTTATAAGTITPAALTITATTNTKVYDATTSASAKPTISGLKGTDTVTGVNEAYVSKDVLGTNGSTLTVSTYTVNDGNSGGNYAVTTVTTTGTITPAALTVTAASNSKVYDATTSASAVPSVGGLLGTDTVTGLSEAYTSKDVLGTNGSTLVVNGYTVNDGNGGNDYTVTTATAKGTISPATLTITALTNTKVYDGTTSASAVPTVSGLLGTDTATGLVESYTSKDVLGTNGSTLVVSGYTVNDGNNGQDYTVIMPSAKGTITAAALTIAATTNTKVYDGTTSAAATPIVSGLKGTDTVNGLSEAYTSKDVKGTNGSTLIVTGYTINDGTGGSDYVVTTTTAAGTITPAALTITATTSTKVYDTTTSASATPTYSGLVGADTLTGLKEAYVSKDVLGTNGSTLVVTGYTINDGNGGNDYTVTTVSAKGTITPAAVTISAVTNTKVYDGTTSAAAIPTVIGLLGSDTVSGLKESYVSKDVLGTNGSTLVVTGYTINDGNGGNDYTVGTNTAAGTITPAALSISAVSNTKVYDATTSAAATPSVTGLKGSDTVTGLSEAYTSKDVHGTNGSTLVINGYVINDGNSGNDYTVTTATASGTITPAALTVTATSNTKVYDATTSAAATPTASGLLGTDTVTGLSEAYQSKNVLGTNGSTLVVTGYTVNDGNSGNDYTVTTVTAKGTITPAALTITATTNTKVYDATTSAAAIPTYSGLLGTDSVTGLKEAYTSKDVLGTNGSTLVVTGYTVNDGNSGADYTVTTASTSGTITPAALTIAAVSATKVYDATTSSGATPTVSGLLGTDTATGLAESYASKDVLGTNNSTLSITSYTVNDGNSGNDYIVTTTTAAGTITPAALTLTATTNTKVYDATTTASATPTVGGLLGTDSVTSLTEAYTSKDVLGTNGSTLTVTGYKVNDGNNGNDYSVTTVTAKGTITPAALTINAVTNTKVYDATTSASAVPTVSGLLGSDTASGLKEAYLSKNVLGTNGSTLSVTGFTITDGNSGNDYTVTTVTASGTITPAALTIAAVTNTKVYDATTTASATPVVSGLLGGDTATGVNEAYASKDVLGTNGSTLSVTAYTLNDGNSGNNYSVTTSTAKGTITPASLSIFAVSNTKTYDATTTAAATPTVNGLLGGDTVTGLKEAYASKDVLGTNGSTLNVTNYTVNDGNGGNDYSVTTFTAKGTITPAALTIGALTNTKVYDATTSAAAIPTVGGLLGSDTATGLKEAYTSKNVLGTNGSTLVVTGYTINDGNSGLDYTVTTTSAMGTITPAGLTLAATTNTKVYDGTTSATALPTTTGLLGSDTVTGLTEHYTAYSALGTNQSVLRVDPGYSVNDGNGGANYNVQLTYALGTITPASLTIAPGTAVKTYDGTTSSNGRPVAISGLVPGDFLSGTIAYTLKNVNGLNGSSTFVTGYSIADGNGGNNYTVTVQTGRGTITPASLTIAAATNTRVYDGTKLASATPIATGLVAGDTVTGLSESYTAYSALGTNNSTLVVNPGYTINDGNGGANYTVSLQSAKGTITPAALTIAAVPNTKAYDTTTSAAAIPTYSGLVPGDYISGLKEGYLSPNVMGTNGSSLQAFGYTIADGNGGANYTVSLPIAKGTITPVALVIAATSNTRVYNGTTSATATPTVTGLLGSDTVTGLGEHYASYNVLGTNKSTLIVNSGYTVNDGNSGGNYTVSVANAFGTITPAALTIAPAPYTKTFDGTTLSSGNVIALSGLVPGDFVSGTTAFVSKNVMGLNGSTLTVTAYTIADGNAGKNYTVTVKSGSGTITPATLTVSATTNTRVYDGTTSAAAIPTVSGLYGSDTVTGLSERYASYNVLGTNGSLLLVNTGYVVNDGNGGANYTVITPSATGTITPKALTLTALTNTKVYDATTSALAKPTATGLIPGDTISGFTESYTSKNVLGTNGSTLVITPGYSIADGNAGKNYSVTAVSAAGTITPASLTISAVTNTKTFDGTVSAVSIPVSTILGTDTISNLTEQYTSPNPMGVNGSTLVVNSGYVINDGNSGKNYSTTTLKTALGTIFPAP